MPPTPVAPPTVTAAPIPGANQMANNQGTNPTVNSAIGSPSIPLNSVSNTTPTLPPSTPASTPITSTSIADNAPIAVPTPPTPSTPVAAAGSIAAAQAGNQAVIDQNAAAVNAAQDSVTSDNSTLQGYIKTLAGQGQATIDAEAAAGVPYLTQLSQSLTKEYQNAQLTYSGQTQAIQNNQSMSVDQRASAISAVTTQHAQDMNNLAIRQNIAAGNLTAVQGLVDKQIDLQYGNLKDIIGYQTSILNSDKTILSDKQTAQLTAQLAQNKSILDEATYQAHALQDAKTTLIQTAASFGAPPSVIANIQAATDLGTAAAAGGEYVQASKYSPVNLGYDKNGNPQYGAFNTRTGAFAVGTSSSATGAGSPNPSTSAVTNVTTQLGVSSSTVATDVDPATLLTALESNEGGSPSGVSNNPSNIKFDGQAGATDSGVKATDGGTFASFNTPADYQKAAVANIKSLSANGATVGDVVAKWTNTTNPDDVQKPTYAQYGKLADTDFDPTNNLDKTAFKYLQSYLSGNVPVARSLGISGTGASGQFAAVANRANDLYFKATGQPMPNVTQVAANLKLIAGNNKLANNLDLQTQTVQGNFGISAANMTANDVNTSSVTPLNGWLDTIKNALGDPATAQYLSQNATLQNEVGSLLAVKNASGTTVHDKLESAGLIPANASLAQQQAIIGTLMKEAGVFTTALNSANQNIYNQTDPLELDPANPARTAHVASTPVLSNGIDLSKFNK